MTNADSVDSAERRVDDELAKYLLGNASTVFAANVLVSAVIAYFMWGQVDGRWLVAWLAVSLLLAAARFVYWWHVRRPETPPESIRRWARHHGIASGLSGVLWGVAAVVFFSDSLAHQTLLILTIAGMNAGAATSHAAYPRAFFAFAAFNLVPLAIRFFMEANEASMGLGIMCFFYLIFLTGVTRSLYRSLRRTVVLGIERESLVEGLSEAKEAAEQLSKAKDALLSRVSHELRTPLNTILGYAQLLERDAGEAGSRAATTISEAGQHLIALIDEIVELTRADVEGIPLTLQRVDTTRCVEDCVEFTRGIAESQGITIRSASLSAPDVTADGTRLREVLLNLLSNAIKFSSPGGKITIAAQVVADGNLRISVTDTGRGIPADAHHVVFEPFGRVKGSAGDVEGTGIGLAVTKRFVELMQGRIGFESVEGAGSTFWFELPIHIAGDDDLQAEVAGVETAATEPPIDLRLIYVEDDPDNRGVMEAIFEHLAPDCRLECAKSAEEGLEMIARNTYDMVLMDINLPGMDGFEAFDKLRAKPETARIPVIAVSAAARPEDRDKALARGFSDYLTKPINVDSLFEAIRRGLGQ